MIPEDLQYTKDHEWVRREGDTVRVGVTDYAQDALGDIVFRSVAPWWSATTPSTRRRSW